MYTCINNVIVHVSNETITRLVLALYQRYTVTVYTGAFVLHTPLLFCWWIIRVCYSPHRIYHKVAHGLRAATHLVGRPLPDNSTRLTTLPSPSNRANSPCRAPLEDSVSSPRLDQCLLKHHSIINHSASSLQCQVFEMPSCPASPPSNSRVSRDHQ